MQTSEEIRAALREHLLEAFADEYKEANETWRAIEGKAQASITIGGIFLAAAFAYARDISKPANTTVWLLVASLLLLLLSVGSAILALRIKRVALPPLGNFVELGVSDLTRDGVDLDESVLARFTEDRVAQWREAIRSVGDENDRKAQLVWYSQSLLALALLPIAVFTLIKIAG